MNTRQRIDAIFETNFDQFAKYGTDKLSVGASYLATRDRLADRYVVMSPDGIPTTERPLRGRAAAEAEKKRFLARFVPQGFYSSAQGRISLQDLARATVIQPA